jgi:pimeloyl-ACP methyl ester carboxylesterase
MSNQTVLFLHGFASSAQSIKARYFRERFGALPHVDFYAIDFNPTPADFECMTTTGQIDRLRQYIVDRGLEGARLIGSSYGGLIALHYAHRYGGVERLLLLAPALFWLSGGLSQEDLRLWQEAGTLPVFHYAFARELLLKYDLHLDGLRYLEFIPPAAPVLIIHGRNDSTVSVDHSRMYAAAFSSSVQLEELDADHDLNPYLDLIWERAQAFLLDEK